jgi:hypothetical protein
MVEDIMVVVEEVIPSQDYQFLFDAGAVVFWSWNKISDAIKNIRNPYRRLIDTLDFIINRKHRPKLVFSIYRLTAPTRKLSIQ